jgi:hypothetical protein
VGLKAAMSAVMRLSSKIIVSLLAVLGALLAVSGSRCRGWSPTCVVAN